MHINSTAYQITEKFLDAYYSTIIYKLICEWHMYITILLSFAPYIMKCYILRKINFIKLSFERQFSVTRKRKKLIIFKPQDDDLSPVSNALIFLNSLLTHHFLASSHFCFVSHGLLNKLC